MIKKIQTKTAARLTPAEKPAESARAETKAEAKPERSRGDSAALSSLKRAHTAISHKVRKHEKKIESAGHSAAMLFWAAGNGTLAPFIAFAVGLSHAIKSGATGTPNEHSVHIGQIGAYVHHAVKLKTRSHVLAATSGILAGTLTDALKLAIAAGLLPGVSSDHVYGEVDPGHEFATAVTKLGRSGLSALDKIVKNTLK